MTESLQRRFQWLGLWLQLSDPRQGDGAGAAERSYPTSEARGGSWEEPPHVQGAVAVRRRGAYSTFKVRRGSGEEIPLTQGKEQRLRFAGAAMKRYPTSKISEHNPLC